jgi:hypothetical protein
MIFDQLDKIAWWAYPIGFGFALLGGRLFIPKVVRKMYDLVNPEFETRRRRFRWQAQVIGGIEAVLYVISLLGGKAEFIAFWVLVKVSVPYIGWKVEKSIDEEKIHEGRCLFMNSLYGNGLSILYSVVGYLIIIWLGKENYWLAFWVAIILILCTQALSDYLEITLRRCDIFWR